MKSGKNYIQRCNNLPKVSPYVRFQIEYDADCFLRATIYLGPTGCKKKDTISSSKCGKMLKFDQL